MSDLLSALAPIVGPEHVTADVPLTHLTDATESRALKGDALGLVMPGDADEVAAVMRLCHDHDTAIVPRGGGTGFAGGAVPVGGELVLSLERLDRIRSFEPERWRMEAEAGVTTSTVRRRARENGLLYPPDPGAGEQSHIGGNVACNAGGPHAFKYGVTGAWVSGMEAVIPPGEVVRSGGRVRKDVAGYDWPRLLIGSEGTLGIVTAVHLRLMPAPDVAVPLVASYADADAGCEAIERVVAWGLAAATLEYLDAGAVAASAGAYPGEMPAETAFLVIAEADGSQAETKRLRDELVEALEPGALAIDKPLTRKAIDSLWRWRDGVSIAVTAQHGGKVSEDIAVPLEHLRTAIAGTLEIGSRHDLPTCSWGHAGDGNLHSTFMLDSANADALARAEDAAAELFELALHLGGTVSGEHGIGLVKRAALARQLTRPELELQWAIKHAFDPRGLLNPGKKLPARP